MRKIVKFIILNPQVNHAAIHPYMGVVFPDGPYTTKLINGYLIATPGTAFPEEYERYAKYFIRTAKIGNLVQIEDYECINPQHIEEGTECHCGLEECETATQYYGELTNKEKYISAVYYEPYED